VYFQYETEKVKYKVEHTYTPDFILANGIWLEAKGYFTGKDRSKMLAVKKQNPEVDIRLVFQAPYNYLSKRSKTTYAKWADKHGFLWCRETEIPREWLLI
jgi:hypothetical protein